MFNKKIGLFFIMILIGLITISSVSAADIFVDSSYNLDDLQNDIDIMTDGETLSFDNGQFEIAGIEITKSINIVGSSNTKISNNGTWGTGTGILINSNFVNVSSLIISGFELGINNYGNDVTISNNTLEDNFQGITNNMTNNVNIINNKFKNNMIYGLNNFLSSDSVISNNIVYGSYIGIGSSGNNVILKNNTAYDNFGGLFVLMSNNAVIKENEVRNNIEAGITLSLYCFDTLIENNDIYDNGECGILLASDYYDMIGNTSIIANNIYNNGVGISVESELDSLITDTNIIGNNIYNNEIGISVESDISSIITGTILNYNRIINNVTELEGNVLINADYNWWGSNNLNMSKIIGSTINNYFMMNIANLSSLNSDGNVKFQYTFKLSDNGIFDPRKLPYFATGVSTTITSGVIKSFDSRFSDTFDITLNSNGPVTYTFVTDFEVQTLEGHVEIVNNSNIGTNDTVVNNKEDTITDIKDNNESTDDNGTKSENEATKNISASAGMKSTGIPFNIILMTILSVLGVIISKKQK